MNYMRYRIFEASKVASKEEKDAFFDNLNFDDDYIAAGDIENIANAINDVVDDRDAPVVRKPVVKGNAPTIKLSDIGKKRANRMNADSSKNNGPSDKLNSDADIKLNLLEVEYFPVREFFNYDVAKLGALGFFWDTKTVYYVCNIVSDAVNKLGIKVFNGNDDEDISPEQKNRILDEINEIDPGVYNKIRGLIVSILPPKLRNGYNDRLISSRKGDYFKKTRKNRTNALNNDSDMSAAVRDNIAAFMTKVLPDVSYNIDVVALEINITDSTFVLGNNNISRINAALNKMEDTADARNEYEKLIAQLQHYLSSCNKELDTERNFIKDIITAATAKNGDNVVSKCLDDIDYEIDLFLDDFDDIAAQKGKDFLEEWWEERSYECALLGVDYSSISRCINHVARLIKIADTIKKKIFAVQEKIAPYSNAGDRGAIGKLDISFGSCKNVIVKNDSSQSLPFWFPKRVENLTLENMRNLRTLNNMPIEISGNLAVRRCGKLSYDDLKKYATDKGCKLETDAKYMSESMRLYESTIRNRIKLGRRYITEGMHKEKMSDGTYVEGILSKLFYRNRYNQEVLNSTNGLNIDWETVKNKNITVYDDVQDIKTALDAFEKYANVNEARKKTRGGKKDNDAEDRVNKSGQHPLLITTDDKGMITFVFSTHGGASNFSATMGDMPLADVNGTVDLMRMFGYTGDTNVFKIRYIDETILANNLIDKWIKATDEIYEPGYGLSLFKVFGVRSDQTVGSWVCSLVVNGLKYFYMNDDAWYTPTVSKIMPDIREIFSRSGWRLDKTLKNPVGRSRKNVANEIYDILWNMLPIDKRPVDKKTRQPLNVITSSPANAITTFKRKFGGYSDIADVINPKILYGLLLLSTRYEDIDDLKKIKESPEDIIKRIKENWDQDVSKRIISSLNALKNADNDSESGKGLVRAKRSKDMQFLKREDLLFLGDFMCTAYLISSCNDKTDAEPATEFTNSRNLHYDQKRDLVTNAFGFGNANKLRKNIQLVRRANQYGLESGNKDILQAIQNATDEVKAYRLGGQNVISAISRDALVIYDKTREDFRKNIRSLANAFNNCCQEYRDYIVALSNGCGTTSTLNTDTLNTHMARFKELLYGFTIVDRRGEHHCDGIFVLADSFNSCVDQIKKDEDADLSQDFIYMGKTISAIKSRANQLTDDIRNDSKFLYSEDYYDNLASRPMTDPRRDPSMHYMQILKFDSFSRDTSIDNLIDYISADIKTLRARIKSYDDANLAKAMNYVCSGLDYAIGLITRPRKYGTNVLGNFDSRNITKIVGAYKKFVDLVSPCLASGTSLNNQKSDSMYQQLTKLADSLSGLVKESLHSPYRNRLRSRNLRYSRRYRINESLGYGFEFGKPRLCGRNWSRQDIFYRGECVGYASTDFYGRDHSCLDDLFYIIDVERGIKYGSYDFTVFDNYDEALNYVKQNFDEIVYILHNM